MLDHKYIIKNLLKSLYLREYCKYTQSINHHVSDNLTNFIRNSKQRKISVRHTKFKRR